MVQFNTFFSSFPNCKKKGISIASGKKDLLFHKDNFYVIKNINVPFSQKQKHPYFSLPIGT